MFDLAMQEREARQKKLEEAKEIERKTEVCNPLAPL